MNRLLFETMCETGATLVGDRRASFVACAIVTERIIHAACRADSAHVRRFNGVTSRTTALRVNGTTTNGVDTRASPLFEQESDPSNWRGVARPGTKACV